MEEDELDYSKKTTGHGIFNSGKNKLGDFSLEKLKADQDMCLFFSSFLDSK